MFQYRGDSSRERSPDQAFYSQFLHVYKIGVEPGFNLFLSVNTVRTKSFWNNCRLSWREKKTKFFGYYLHIFTWHYLFPTWKEKIVHKNISFCLYFHFSYFNVGWIIPKKLRYPQYLKIRFSNKSRLPFKFTLIYIFQL